MKSCRDESAFRSNPGQLSKLVGVAPIACESGNKEGKRSTYAGRSMVRKVLYMAALVATKPGPTAASVLLETPSQRQTEESHPRGSDAQAVDHVEGDCKNQNGASLHSRFSPKLRPPMAREFGVSLVLPVHLVSCVLKRQFRSSCGSM